jgi:formylglycine-generating enzyme required for sulfatase activity
MKFVAQFSYLLCVSFIMSCTSEPLAPVASNVQIIINNSAEYTSSRDVELTLILADAGQMQISNNSDFTGAVWEPFVGTKDWELLSGDGTKTVYARFRNDFLIERNVNNEIILDTFISVGSFSWIGLSGAQEPFGFGDRIRFELQMSSSQETGSETGGTAIIVWPGVFEEAEMTDESDGNHTFEYEFSNWVISTEAVQLSFLDRAGNQTSETIASPDVMSSNIGAMVEVHSGAFTMGQNYVATPMHEVTLNHDFLLGKYEVTNANYCFALNWALDAGILEQANSSGVRSHSEFLLEVSHTACEIDFNGTLFVVGTVYGGDFAGQAADDHPVEEVSWYGAACYCDWLSMMDGLTPYYSGDWDQNAGHDPYTATGYRLPTGAEWEYAARYNDGRTYPWVLIETGLFIEYANYNYNVSGTSPVGSYPLGASQLDLMDMAGNLQEWVGDWYGSYSSSPQSDPYGSADGSHRGLRGGGWANNAEYLPSAQRNRGNPEGMFSDVGFRLCRTANP